MIKIEITPSKTIHEEIIEIVKDNMGDVPVQVYGNERNGINITVDAEEVVDEGKITGSSKEEALISSLELLMASKGSTMQVRKKTLSTETRASK